jgi:hypothetical protein
MDVGSSPTVQAGLGGNQLEASVGREGHGTAERAGGRVRR